MVGNSHRNRGLPREDQFPKFDLWLQSGEPDNTAVFQGTHAQSGRFIWTYSREGPALGFVRDVARIRNHHDASQFELRRVDSHAQTTIVARGEDLVRLALQDPVL